MKIMIWALFFTIIISAIIISDLPHSHEETNNSKINIQNYSGLEYRSISTIPVNVDPLDIAINPDTNKIYINYGADGTISVISSLTNTIIKSINANCCVDHIAINQNTNKIYFTDGRDNIISVIDGSTDTLSLKKINVGSGNSTSSGIAVNQKTNKIYVSNYQDNTVSVINGSTDNIIGKPIPVGHYPQKIAINQKTNKIYVATDVKISVIDGTNDTVNSIPAKWTNDIAVNPNTNKIYITDYLNAGDPVNVIDGSTNTITGRNIVTGYEVIKDIAVNPKTNQVYVTGDNDTIVIIDGSTDTMSGSITLGNTQYAEGIALDPNTSQVYVVNSNGPSYYGPNRFTGDNYGSVSVISYSITVPEFGLLGPVILIISIAAIIILGKNFNSFLGDM